MDKVFFIKEQKSCETRKANSIFTVLLTEQWKKFGPTTGLSERK